MESALPLSSARIIAHRGDRSYAPENTLAAIRQAAGKGARWVEFDATLTGDTDQPVVIFHDDEVGRTTNLGPRPITEVGFEELRAADAGSWFSPAFAGERVPTLAEVIALCDEVGLCMNIEVKISSNGDRQSPEPFDEALAELTARRVVEDMLKQRQGSLHHILLSSFSSTALFKLGELVPHVPRGYLLDKMWPDDLADARLPEFSRRLALIKPQTVNLNQALLSGRGQVEQFRNAIRMALGQDLPILAYTVNSRARWQELQEWGVHGVFTDMPGDLLTPLSGETKASGADRF